MDETTRAQVAFPAGRQFTLTWSIPDDFGGMTSALLHRSRAFARLAGTPVSILTFDARPDYSTVEHDLRARGELTDGVQLVNIWDWFRSNPVPQDAPGKADTRKHGFSPLGTGARESTRRGDRELSRTRSSGSAVGQVDYYREDGTLLASDWRDAEGGRSVTLCDAHGQPLSSFGSVWGLYRFWLDLLTEGEQSFLTVDSKPVAAFIATYKRKNAVVLHVVHSSHLEEEDTEEARIKASRQPVFENLGAYDSVVLLTQRQKSDVQKLFGARDNLAVIGNGRILPDEERDDIPRPIGAGIMLASLQTRKRVDHAVRAIARAAAVHPEVTLDVYGDGPDRDRVAATITETDAPVRLRGHVPGARDLLGGASFLLLTSTSEGLPLVLVESMAVGCIPIAYDIPYGPADVIKDGTNGFLVRAGETEGVAKAIDTLIGMPPRKVAAMRKAARKTAQQFSDLAITRLWAAEFRAAAGRHTASTKKPFWKLR